MFFFWIVLWDMMAHCCIVRYGGSLVYCGIWGSLVYYGIWWLIGILWVWWLIGCTRRSGLIGIL
jgi:hypothetical protein